MPTVKQYKKVTSPWQRNNVLIILIIVNVLFLFALLFIKTIYLILDHTTINFYSNILNWFALPANIKGLLYRPWTLCSYMFSHVDIWQSLSNMVWLWGFGSILKNLVDSKKIIPIYLYGGWVGAAVYIIAMNTIPALRAGVDSSVLLGASASVMAISIATTTLAPNYRIFPFIQGGIPLWVFTAIYLIINLISIPLNAPEHWAQLGGGLIGFIFIWQLKKGNDWGKWMYTVYRSINSWFDPIHKKKSHRKTKPPPFRKTAILNQQKIDQLLDKINEHGYNALTQEEKDILRRASEKL